MQQTPGTADKAKRRNISSADDNRKAEFEVWVTSSQPSKTQG